MADFHYSSVVCNCKHVTLGEIIHSIQAKNAKNIKEIGSFTDAGIACGCCKRKEDDYGTPKMDLYLDQIVKKFVP